MGRPKSVFSLLFPVWGAPIQVCLSPSRRTKKEGEGGGGMDSKSTPILFLILAVWPGATIQPAHRQGWKQNPTFIALAKLLAAVHLNRTGFVLTSPHVFRWRPFKPPKW